MSKDIDEILEQFAEYFNPTGDDRPYLNHEQAKEAIQDLINKARIEVWERVDQLKEQTNDKGVWYGQRETFESVFMGLPDGCMLKTPNNFNTKYTVTYKENSRNSLKTQGDTPKEAVIKMAEQLKEQTNEKRYR